MKKGQLVSLLVAMSSLLAFGACSNLEVNTAQAPDVSFAQYKTYAWANSPAPGPQGEPLDLYEGSILDQTIKSTTEEKLMEKGLSPAKNAPPDLLISYAAKTRMGVQYGVATTPWGWDDRAAYPVREGSITLEITDAHTGTPIWQGTASDIINRAGPSQKDVASAVTKMLDKYPAA